MSSPEKYIPLSERVQQDVWHDNFVPKFSALASAPPNKLVLIGVWVIFVPIVVQSAVIGLGSLFATTDPVAAVITAAGAAFYFALAVAILVHQTQRFRRAKTLRDDDDA